MQLNLVSDELKQAWKAVEAGALTLEAFEALQQRLLAGYRDVWRDALRLPGHADLAESLASELGSYVGIRDREEIDRRMHAGVQMVAAEWRERVDARDPASIEQFYDASTAYLYDLMSWHTLKDDQSPLGYVTGLALALEHGCRDHLDFGSGVGAGSLLFAANGLSTALADISGNLLAFARWRLGQRGVQARAIDLKTASLPDAAFDIVTAMDVFEHLIDPVDTIDRVWRALRPGGFLFGRFHADPDAGHPQHIVFDFGPTFERLRERGFEEVWRDDWLWGHQAFRRG